MRLYYIDHKQLRYIPMNIKHYVGILFVSFVLFSSIGFTSAIRVNTALEKIPIIVKYNNEKIDEEWVEAKLLKLNAEHIDILIAQSKLESGNYSSEVFKQNKNLFGMRQSFTRASTNVGTNLNHAIYDSYYDSVIDIVLWQQKYASKLTREEYLQVLQQCYAEDRSYIQKLNKIIQK